MLSRSVYPLFILATVLTLLAPRPQRALADQRQFTLINGSATVVITHVYVSAAIVDDWQEDVLGQDVLAPGDTVTIHFSAADADAGLCLYDIRIDGSAGEQGFLYAIDLCATDTVTFS